MCVEHDRDAAAGIALVRRTRAVGRQFEQRRGAFEMAFPEGDLGVQDVALQPGALPGRIVGVLDRERRQRVGQALREGRVQGADLAHQHAHRPAVGDDVVGGDQQDVFVVGQAQQLAADQRPGRQVERPDGLGAGDLADQALPGRV